MAALPRRILKETERLMADPPPGISGAPANDNLRYFTVSINGPESSPYEGKTLLSFSLLILGGVFKLELFLPEEYPMVAPKIRFLTKIYHPNIDKLGRICMDTLKGGPYNRGRLMTGNWSPALQIRTVLLSIQALLSAPNPDGMGSVLDRVNVDPLAADVAAQWKENEAAAIATGIHRYF